MGVTWTQEMEGGQVLGDESEEPKPVTAESRAQEEQEDTPS